MAAGWKSHTKDRKFTFFSNEEEQSFREPFYFIQGADIQFGLTVAYNNESAKPDWSAEIIKAEKAVDCINALRPRPSFFVICGDLCNAFPVEEPELRAQQEADFKRIFSKIDPSIPLVCVCGNHDVGDQPTEEGVSMYRSSFGDEYFSFWKGGVLFIVLNSQYYFDSSKIQKISAEHETWLESTLAEGKRAGARIMVFQHIPWFIDNIDEPFNYFNLPASLRKTALEKLHSAGVTHVFSGHLHYNAAVAFKSIELVTSSAIGLQLGKDSSGLRIVKVFHDQVQHVYHSLDQFPTTVKL